MLRRNISDHVREALLDRPVVLVNGARQTGKTTLVQSLVAAGHQATYVSLDEAPAHAAAYTDPAGFLSRFEGPVILDEIQRAPELFLAIKVQVDRARIPGRFLLTGSSDILLLPRLADALPGRMEILTLWPLSQGEIAGVREGLIDVLFSDQMPVLPRGRAVGAELWERIVRGGLPEAQALVEPRRREAWFGSYLTTILQRDVRDVSNVAGLTELPRLLALLAARGGTLLNAAEVSSSSGLPWNTLRRYMALLQGAFLVQTVPAWSGGQGVRLIKRPKLLVVDSGLMAFLLGVGAERLAVDQGPLGGLLENFVIMDLWKQATWSRTRPAFSHFRTSGQQEVDLVLEDRRGRVVGVEVKRSATVGPGDFQGLRALATAAGARFWRGVVLYGGEMALPFGGRFHAVPIEAVWRTQAPTEPNTVGEAAPAEPYRLQASRPKPPLPVRRAGGRSRRRAGSGA